MTETKEEWRAVLMSTKDYAYRNRTVDVISEDDSVSIPIPNDEVLCNACNEKVIVERLKEIRDAHML